MDAAIFVATISAAASILAAALTFLLTKSKEREAELRKQKLEHYKEFLDALSGIVGTDSTAETNAVGRGPPTRWDWLPHSRFCKPKGAFRTRLQSAPNRSTDEHDRCLNQLLLAIRHDLGVTPADDPHTFAFRLWCSGTQEGTPHLHAPSQSQ
jgi:hypothetical protein